jgi:general secretion pathway protein L
MTTSTHRVHDGPARTSGAAWAARWDAWVEAVRSRLAPPSPVLLLRADGSRAVWLGDAPLPPGATGKAPQFVAVEVPDDLLLHRTLDLPRLTPELAADAVQLDVRSSSPFAPDDLAWGSTVRETPEGGRRAYIAIASRRQLSQYLATHGPEPAAASPAPEAWALAGSVPIVITGYGEPARLAQAASRARWDVALVGLALLLAALVAMTPTIQLHFRAAEAARQYEAVATRAAPLVRRRDELMALNDSLKKLDAASADRVDPASVMEYLTRILPDDTYLYSLEVRKAKITAGGHTVDAAALLQKLSADPRLKDVRAPTAVTRVPGATKEAFTVEFTMEPAAPIAVPTAAAGEPAPVTGNPVAAAAAAAPAVAAASGPTLGAAGASAAPAAPAAAASAAAATPGKAPAAGGGSPFAIGGSRQ